MPTDTLQRYLADVGSVPLLTPEEESQLAILAQQGNKAARDKMVCSNLRLVVSIAGDYFGSGLPFLDILSEGNLGLIKAVERFDPFRRCKLSTYASWWIREFIVRAISKQSGVISVPPRAARKAAKLRRASEHLAQSLGRDPGEEELAEELGVTQSSISHARTHAARTASLDAETAAGTSLLDTLACDRTPDPSEAAIAADMSVNITSLLQGLAPREQEVVRTRFGLDGHAPKTLREIGAKLGYTRERIRQIEAKALEKLRAQIRKAEPMPEMA